MEDSEVFGEGRFGNLASWEWGKFRGPSDFVLFEASFMLKSYGVGSAAQRPISPFIFYDLTLGDLGLGL